MLVKLSDEVSVNPECVSSVTVNSDYDGVTVSMVDGNLWYLGRDYNSTIWQTVDRITKLINGDSNG